MVQSSLFSYPGRANHPTLRKKVPMTKILPKAFLVFLLPVMLLFSGCSRPKNVEKYYRFSNCNWNRFNKLHYEFNLEKNGTFDVYLEVRLKKSFSHDDLPVNMVMNTPSGEERTRECQIIVKNGKGELQGECRGDSSCIRVVLKRGLLIAQKGLLSIELENLTPRIETPDILAAGIILSEKR